VKIKLNADNLRKKIKDIRDLADRAETARTQIDAAFERESDPVSPDDFLTQSNDGIQRIKTVADKVEKSMNTIISLNENGVGKMEGDDYTLDIPDDAHVTDSNSLEDWAGKEQAAADADDLESYTKGGSKRTNRSYDEIIRSIDKNKTNSRYAAAFIDSVGAENLTQIPLHVNTSMSRELCADPKNAPDNLAALFGDVLSSASREWDDNKSSEVAKKIVGPLNDPENYRRVKVLNAMMGGHDADRNGVNDLKFGKSFLLNMATEAEKLDYQSIMIAASENKEPMSEGRPGIVRQSTDPLAGVLDAMGNNEEAALEFLAPAKSGEPGTADTARLDRLTHRWDELESLPSSRDGFSGLTAAIAAASKLRASNNTAERSRADTLSDDAIHFVAGNVSKDLYDDSAKKRLAVLLANCSGEVTASWSAQGGHGQLAVANKTHFNATADDLDKLAYRIVDNRDAASTLSAGLANYAKTESQRGLLNNKDQPESMRLDGIRGAYANGTKAVSHLQGLGEIRAEQLTENNAAAAAAAKESTTTAVNVFSAVLSTGLGAVGGPAGVATAASGASKALPVVTAFANPIIIDNLTGDAGKAKKVTSNVPSDSKEAIWAASVQDAADANLLQESDFSTPVTHKDKDGNEVETPAHDYYKWIVPKPGGGYTIDLSKGGDNAAAELGTWTKTARDANADRNVGDGEQPPIDKNLSFLEPDGKTGDGKAEGETAGRSLKGNGG
jgi:hypothetical protein